MKSLWIVNKCCGALHQKLYGKKSTGGQWLEAMLEEAYQHKDDQIVVVTIEKSPKLQYFNDGNISYYTLEGEPNANYDYKSKKALSSWKNIIEKEQPDIIEIWGTEFPHSLAALNAAPQIPSVVYVQGILDSISKYYLSGLTDQEIKKAITIRDILTRTTIRQTKKTYAKRFCYEKEIVQKAGHIIVENQWAKAYYTKINPDIQAHFLSISISKSFQAHTWGEEEMLAHTLMCPAANYPIKGLHMLLKALVIVKRIYPDIHLNIPGTVLKETKSLKSKLKQNGYDRLIRQMIVDLELQNNVSYIGRLTADEMAKEMSKANCFIMCSSIENHSSTLKEAMTVGTPCIASYVGGVPEYATNEYNCLLYRFEDYEVLAHNICRIFEDKHLRESLSTNAIKEMRAPKGESDYAKMSTIFKNILKDN